MKSSGPILTICKRNAFAPVKPASILSFCNWLEEEEEKKQQSTFEAIFFSTT
jgi:hypothetical protein